MWEREHAKAATYLKKGCLRQRQRQNLDDRLTDYAGLHAEDWQFCVDRDCRLRVRVTVGIGGQSVKRYIKAAPGLYIPFSHRG